MGQPNTEQILSVYMFSDTLVRCQKFWRNQVLTQNTTKIIQTVKQQSHWIES